MRVQAEPDPQHKLKASKLYLNAGSVEIVGGNSQASVFLPSEKKCILPLITSRSFL